MVTQNASSRSYLLGDVALRHTKRCQISHPTDVIIGRDTQVRENRQWAVWRGQKQRRAKKWFVSFNCFAFSREATQRKALIRWFLATEKTTRRWLEIDYNEAFVGFASTSFQPIPRFLYINLWSWCRKLVDFFSLKITLFERKRQA